MDLRHLRYFVAVAEAGSLTAAAANLHISQPPLSVAIAKLENEVGVKLLERSHRGVEPTTAGRYLLDAASRVLGEVDAIVTTLGRFGSGTAGALRIASVPVLTWHRLRQALRRFGEIAPDVELALLDPPPWTALELLDQGAVDLAAVMVADHERFVERHSGGYSIVDWGPVPLVAVLPPETETGASQLPLSYFDNATLLMPRRTAAVPSVPEAVDAALREHGVTPKSIRTLETIQTILPLIEAGAGGGILPDPDRASLARFDVRVSELEPQPQPLRALVLARGDAASAPAQRFLDVISATKPEGSL